MILRSLFLGGLSTGRAATWVLRSQMSFSTLLSLGSVIQIHGPARHGRKAKDWRNLIAHRRTLLLLDGLEPLQYPPGPQEGRLREPALQALLRELAAFNRGLCVITTRMPSLKFRSRTHFSSAS